MYYSYNYSNEVVLINYKFIIICIFRSVIAQSSVMFQPRITNKRKMGMLRRSFRKFKTRRMMDDYNL